MAYYQDRDSRLGFLLQMTLDFTLLALLTPLFMLFEVIQYSSFPIDVNGDRYAALIPEKGKHLLKNPDPL